ncbi:hypothetical protein B0T26DRAFT_722696 [Lasiosphaeria miniovina]|uniref:Uncharacterized protein n=1 Tax=Lasiosphaeria miniovina TaxID=1954250 RepID=A0AA40A5P4_9PEZI|nr:uncharacterized protein B0T26DRAFT_722696 [Lasiosphaeria miniovina]KAK0709722.1 hypothetical protein B0T26DRAFT_722696 [Lasiosphaeria miniovina]
MPQDLNLYGQRPAKKQRKELALPSSLAFTSQLSSLLAVQNAATSVAATTTTSSSSTMNAASAAPSTSSNTAIPGRARPSKSKTDLLFLGVKKRKAGKGRHDDSGGDAERDRSSAKLSLKDPVGTEGDKAERAQARRKMESKARLYAAMQRGDYVGREVGLVDFDRKWAEKAEKKKQGHGGSSSSSSSGDDNNEEEDSMDTEVMEYEDEFGRLRRGTRAEKLRLERQLARGQASAAELERMSARPRAPENLIVGDAVQIEAFAALDADAMDELARNRDRSATPPPATHYQADREIRNKGVGFYAFSKEEDRRAAEMTALDAERTKTEALRKEREDKAAARRREIEMRRKEIGERKAKKMADSFLDGLSKDIQFVAAGAESGGVPDNDK